MPSFDVVSTVDLQEVRNAVDQVQREISTRYDFRGSKTSVELNEKEGLIDLAADDNLKLQALQQILREKLARRKISLKCVKFEDPVKAGGDILKQLVRLKLALSDEELRKLNKVVKGAKLKVTVQTQGDQLRVTGKKKDELQQVMQLLRADASDLELQYINFRD